MTEVRALRGEVTAILDRLFSPNGPLTHRSSEELDAAESVLHDESAIASLVLELDALYAQLETLKAERERLTALLNTPGLVLADRVRRGR